MQMSFVNTAFGVLGAVASIISAYIAYTSWKRNKDRKQSSSFANYIATSLSLAVIVILTFLGGVKSYEIIRDWWLFREPTKLTIVDNRLPGIEVAMQEGVVCLALKKFVKKETIAIRESIFKQLELKTNNRVKVINLDKPNKWASLTVIPMESATNSECVMRVDRQTRGFLGIHKDYQGMNDRKRKGYNFEMRILQ